MIELRAREMKVSAAGMVSRNRHKVVNRQQERYAKTLFLQNSGRILGSGLPNKPFGMERLLLDKYCQASSCQSIIAVGDTGFVSAMVADSRPVIAADVLSLVRESPRGPILRWLYSVFTRVE